MNDEIKKVRELFFQKHPEFTGQKEWNIARREYYKIIKKHTGLTEEEWNRLTDKLIEQSYE